jgi:dihydropteroate synthase
VIKTTHRFFVEMEAMRSAWTTNHGTLTWGQKTHVMGILNVTPDSFSDGGQFDSLEGALAQARAMVDQGADILDIGGESARPGSQPVSEAAELQRVLPVIRALRAQPLFDKTPISVDTVKASVARAAIESGADFVNDVSGGMADPEMLAIVAALGCPIVLMHMRGTPNTMQQMTEYEDVVQEVRDRLAELVNQALAAGVLRDMIAVDPGIGFAKTARQNLPLLRDLAQFQTLGCPVLVGVSRKSFIGAILDRPNPKDRLWGTAAACSAAIAGGTDILRVHDVAQMAEVRSIADAIWR